MAGVLVCVAVVLGACSNNGSPASSGSTTTTTTAARSTTSSTTSGTLVPQSATATEFYSPTKNISCEIDDNFGTSNQTQALCLTITPARSVTLKTDGSLSECTGQQCLSNAGTDTPTLAYGTSVTLGPFTCRSATSGVTCTLANGDGFLIAASGVAPRGDATVSGG